VCYEGLTHDVIKTECAHAFHADCIGPWMARSPTCPTCRTVLGPAAVVADFWAPEFPNQLRPFPFSCRTMGPGEVDRWGFTTVAGFEIWLERVMGGVNRRQVQGVREWCRGAASGDVLYLNDDLTPVGADAAEFAIRCNQPIVV
jgi:hypothetical protein